MDFDRTQETRGENEEDKMVFYYNREERLKNAPKNVQDLYNGNFKVFKPGLFRALVSTKSNRLAFFVLVLCFALVLFLAIFNKRNEGTLNGIPLELTAFSFEENVYASLKFCAPSKKYAGSGRENIDVYFEFLDADKNPVHKGQELFIYEGKESFLRTTFRDYDIFYVMMRLELGEKSVELTANVEKR